MATIAPILSIREGIDDIAQGKKGRVDAGGLLQPVAGGIGRTLAFRAYFNIIALQCGRMQVGQKQ